MLGFRDLLGGDLLALRNAQLFVQGALMSDGPCNPMIGATAAS